MDSADDRPASGFLACLLVLVVLGAAPGQAQTRDTRPARMVRESMQQILDAARSHPDDTSARLGAIRSAVSNQVDEHFAFESMTRRIFGPKVRRLSDHELHRVQTLLARIVRKLYGQQLEALSTTFPPNQSDLTFSLGSVRGRERSRRVPVTFTLKQKDRKRKVNLVFTLRHVEDGGPWRVHDVKLQNLSLVNFYRNQLGTFFADATPDELIQRMQMRARG